MSSRDDWAKAYARQAAADYETWETLQTDKRVPECHRLQFLQMACEKLTKAHLCNSGSNPKDLQTSHAYISKTLPVIIRQQLLHTGSRRGVAWLVLHAKHLAREIESLAPAIKRGG